MISLILLHYRANDYISYFNCGLYYQYLQDFENAEQMYLRAIQLAPEWQRSRKNYATLLKEHQMYESALEEYLILVLEDPNNPSYALDCARMYSQLKDFANAEKYFAAFLAIDGRASAHCTYARFLYHDMDNTM